MTNRHILFPKAEDYYSDLVNRLERAQSRI